MSQAINVRTDSVMPPVMGAQPEPAKSTDFDSVVLAHLDAAYNLARWLGRDENDAEDIVQEASLRAFRFFGGFRGGDSRAWLLKIVRNTAFTWLKRNRPADRPADALNPTYRCLAAWVEDPEVTAQRPEALSGKALFLAMTARKA